MRVSKQIFDFHLNLEGGGGNYKITLRANYSWISDTISNHFQAWFNNGIWRPYYFWNIAYIPSCGSDRVVTYVCLSKTIHSCWFCLIIYKANFYDLLFPIWDHAFSINRFIVRQRYYAVLTGAAFPFQITFSWWLKNWSFVSNFFPNPNNSH